MDINVGVIGAGIMGADHIRNLAGRISGARVSMVADLDLDRARASAADAGATATTEPAELIASPQVDAVVIASHDSTHAPLLRLALDARKPVLCEKPLAPTVEEGRAVVDAEDALTAAGGTPLISLGFMRRFDPAHTDLQEAIAAGRLGEVLMVHCLSRNVRSAPGSDNVSAITNSAIHELDSIPWLLGAEITETAFVPVRKSSSLAPETLQDPSFMMFRTADGTLTTLELFLNAEYGYSTRCEVVGEQGTASFTEAVPLTFNLDRRSATEYPADWRPRFADAYRIQLQAWIDALRTGGASPLASARDGLRASQAAAAMTESFRRGDGAFVPVDYS